MLKKLKKLAGKLQRKSKLTPQIDEELMPVSKAQSGDAMEDGYLFNFRADQFNSPIGWGNNSAPADSNTQTPASAVPAAAVKKLMVRPKDVLQELERRPTQLDLQCLDQKIAILEQKAQLIAQHHAKRELQALIACLQLRKRYDDPIPDRRITYREYFARFDATDELKINALCTKHDLMHKGADIFIPEFPVDAVQIMAEYTTVVQGLTTKKPLFSVIANKDQFRSADGKRDPILLGQSPFGFYYYILGAWAEEMMYLPEL